MPDEHVVGRWPPLDPVAVERGRNYAERHGLLDGTGDGHSQAIYDAVVRAFGYRDQQAAEERRVLEAERDQARRTLAAVCRVIQLPPDVASHIALHPPMLGAEQMEWARGVAERLAATQEDRGEDSGD